MSYQPMTPDQVAALLVVAMAYDNRKPGDATVAAWTEAALRGRWTFETAVEAIHAHYATSTDFLMPGHITARIRQRYRQPAAFLALPPASPASQETRERVQAMVGERFSLPGDPRCRRPERKSADHAAAVEAARAELDAVRERLPEESP